MVVDGKKSKLIPVFVSCIGMIATSLVLGCISWFSINNKFKPTNLTSSVLTSYFDSLDSSNPADGSAENPFLITKPAHLYNLIGLHKTDKLFEIDGIEKQFWEFGFYFEFGKDMFDVNGHYGGTDGDKEFYSYNDQGVLEDGIQSNYLNMNYYFGDNALSPIGTATHPFTGHIYGNNLTVTNIHIKGDGCADIGIFGYVTEDASIENLYFDGVDIDVRNVDLQNDMNAIYHPQRHDKVNVGYIAGHVEKNDSFSHVYVNNCKIHNSEGTEVAQNNDYGYFGCTSYGLGNPVPSGEGFQYELNPDKMYDYLETNYNSFKSSGLRLRGDYIGNGTGSVSSALQQGSSGGNHYDIIGDNGDGTVDHSYSFASIGYEEGDAVQNVWYREGAAYNSLPTNTQVMEDEPVVAGNYAYYNGSTWDFYRNTSNNTPASAHFIANTVFFTTTRPDLTDYIWTWYWDSGKFPRRYLTHSNGGVGSIDNVGYNSNSGQYFAVVDYPGMTDNTHGEYIQDGQYVRSDANRTVYIMDHISGSPVKYLYVANNNVRNLKWGEYEDAADPEQSLGCAFHMNGGLGAVMSFKVGTQKYVLAYQNNEIRAIPEGSGTPAYFSLCGAGCNDSNLKADSFNLVTNANDLQNNNEICIAYGLNPQNGGVEVMSAKQSTYNRKSVSNQVTNSGGVAQMMDNAEFAHLTLRRNAEDSTWSFYDETYDGFLSATSSFSDQMQIGEIFNNNSHFTISIDSSGAATIKTKGGEASHNVLRYDVENGVFSCFDIGKQPVYIYKRQNDGLRDRVFLIQGASQNCYANFGGVKQNISPMYWSTPGESALTKFTRFVEGPEAIGDFNFRATGYESTTTVEMSQGSGGGTLDGWVRCMEASDLTAGCTYVIATYSNTYCSTAGPLVDGSMQQVTGTTFGGNGKMITVLDPNALQFTLEGSSGHWKFLYGDDYLCNGGKGQLNFDDEGNNEWTITFADNFYVTIQDNEGSGGKILYNLQEGNERFTTMDLGKDILLYKKSDNVANITFIADEIAATMDPYYQCNVIDPTGGCGIYSDGLVLYPGSSVYSPDYYDKTDAAHGTTGSQFYNMFATKDVVNIKVPNFGSLDFGTITITGEGESPVFMKGLDYEEDMQYLAFNDGSIRCENESKVEGQFKYTLNLNIYNIYNLSYCSLGLDEDGKSIITSSYDTTSGQVTPNENITGYYDVNTKKKDEHGDDTDERVIDKFVLTLGNVTDSNCKITKIEYKFNAADGNMINFGKVGYRTAIYEGGETDGLGNNVKEASLVSGPVMNFEYEIPTGGAYMFAQVEYTYDSIYEKYVYSITVRCSVDMTIIIFNYDAQRELVKVNGVLRSGAYNSLLIEGTEPPIGGWSK